MKSHNFLIFLIVVYITGFGFLWHNRLKHVDMTHYSVPTGDRLTTFTPMYTSLYGEYEPSYIQCPILMEDRVLNRTREQCVWAAIETLGRWVGESRLTHPPITGRFDYQGYASPSIVANKLTSLGVKFEQSYQSRETGRMLIKRAMKEGRGCLFGATDHAMVLVHYDEQANIAKWIDNSDQSLKVQTMTVSEFHRRWDLWVLVVYADNDVLVNKMEGRFDSN